MCGLSFFYTLYVQFRPYLSQRSCWRHQRCRSFWCCHRRLHRNVRSACHTLRRVIEWKKNSGCRIFWAKKCGHVWPVFLLRSICPIPTIPEPTELLAPPKVQERLALPPAPAKKHPFRVPHSTQSYRVEKEIGLSNLLGEKVWPCVACLSFTLYMPNSDHT